jgi:hypothetical protein
VFSIAKPTVRKTAITLALKLPGAGRVAVTATIEAGGKRIAYDTAAATVRAAGAKRFVLTPGGKAKAALKRLRSAKVTITVTFTPTGAKPTRKTARATVNGTRR